MADRLISRKAAGLHRTILVSVTLLLAAALLFAGFLLLKHNPFGAPEEKIEEAMNSCPVACIFWE